MIDNHIPTEEQGPFSTMPKGVLGIVLALLVINKLSKGKYGAATQAGITYILGLTNRVSVSKNVKVGVEEKWLERVDTKPQTIRLGPKALQAVGELQWKKF